jgi:hypothetical protein
MESTVTLGRFFEAWQRENGRTSTQLAEHLGLAPDQLAALASEHVVMEAAGELGESVGRIVAATPAPSLDQVERIGRRRGADLPRLIDVVIPLDTGSKRS